MMKFSYRIAFLLLVCVIAIPLYLWLSGDSRSIKKIHLMQSQIWPVSVTHHPVIQFHEECKFSIQANAKSDIDTFNVYSILNDERKDKDRLNGKKSHRSDTASQKIQEAPKAPVLPPKKINETMIAIIVPHSHNDPGWLNTLEDYFEGQSRPTLNNMIQKLKKYPKMTFIWAESVFLSMWWDQLSMQDKRTAKELVKNGQLEIVVGSWVVPDEANPHYFAVIDQMIEGHQWLTNTLGAKPRNTWALDPFGYTSTFSYLYKNAGFDNMVVLRVHRDIKEQLQNNRSLEFYWRQHWDNTGVTDIQTLMMPYMLYNVKHTCGPDTHICLEFDFRQIEGEMSESRAVPITDLNIEEKARKLIGQYRKKSNLYKHNVVLIPLGDDFRYDRSIEWDQQYKNYIKLFNYINTKTEYNVEAKFGTVQDYFTEVEKQMKHIYGEKGKKLNFPTLSGDFFPYTDRNEQYWTGYFTTRPFHKKYGRELEHHLRAADILSSLTNAASEPQNDKYKEWKNMLELLTTARQNLGLFQHHDAITGTARDFVANAYLERLRDGVTGVKNVIEFALKKLLSTGNHNRPELLDSRALSFLNPHLDLDQKPLKVEVGGTDILLFNPTAQERNELVRVIVNTEFIEMKDAKGNILPCQVNPLFAYGGAELDLGAELVFYASLLPLGVTKYTLFNRRGQSPKETHPAHINFINRKEVNIVSSRLFKVGKSTKQTLSLENEHLKAIFSPRLGTLKNVILKKSNKTFSASIRPMMYTSRGSGAYIFFPEGEASDSVFSHKPLIRVIKGPLVEEIHVIQTYIEHRVIVSKTSGPEKLTLDVENIVDIQKTKDKELILRLNTNVKHPEKIFFTDSNGFHVIRRQTFSNFPVYANYYPMTSMVYIDDGGTRVTLFSNQPVGVASLEPGSVEVMLDRRLQYDDERGLGQGIFDNKPVISQFKLLFENRDKAIKPPTTSTVSFPSLQSHSISDQMYHPVLIFSLLGTNPELVPTPYSPLKSAFPCDIMLVNLRFHNILEKMDPAQSALILHHKGFDCSFPTEGLRCQTTDGQVILNSLFRSIKIATVDEMSLSLLHKKKKFSAHESLSISPMQLGSYLLTFQPSYNVKV